VLARSYDTGLFILVSVALKYPLEVVLHRGRVTSVSRSQVLLSAKSRSTYAARLNRKHGQGVRGKLLPDFPYLLHDQRQ
jgi:hypothetical protein